MITIPNWLTGNIHYTIDGIGDFIMVDGAPGYSEQHYKLFDTSTGNYTTVNYRRLNKIASKGL